MKAKDARIINIFDKDNKQVYKIPVYQRRYSWGIEQVKRLLDDIERVCNIDQYHFTGSIIYKAINNDSILIDGQQRLITVSLVLKVISLLDKEFKFNNEKIVACEEDDKDYKAIMTSDSFDEIYIDDKLRLKENFSYIKERVENNLDTIKKGIEKLIAVEIKLEDKEDPQEVFESINSLGLKLTPSDLIRNFLLMSLEYDKQKTLYNNQWRKMQYEIIGEDYVEEYVNNYIMFKTGEVLNKDNVYKTYVDFANASNKSHEELIKELTYYAKFYNLFVRDDDNHRTIRVLMKEIRSMDQTTPYPFLLHVFDDWKNNIIDEKNLEEIINLIVIYLVRRIVVDNVPSSTLRVYFLKLYKNIFNDNNENRTKENYYKAIYKYMTSSYSRRDKMPSEDEFIDNLKTYHLYSNRKFGNYLLGVIEQGRYNNISKERIIVDECSIEHIMPQTLTEEWKRDLEDDYERIHNTYLHTIGNLSLSASRYNTSYSNRSFLEKKKMLVENASKFSKLNQEFNALDKFTEIDIIKRADRLIKEVKKYYSLKDVDTSDIKFEQVSISKSSLKINRMYLQTTAVSYTFEADKIAKYEEYVSNYYDIFRSVIEHVYKEYPQEIRSLATSGYKIWTSSKPYFYIGKAEKYDYQIDEDLALHINYGNDYLIFSLTSILQKIGINPEGLVITFKEKHSDFDKLELAKKKYIVFTALQEIAKESKILYDFENEESNTSYIKFNIESLKVTFRLNSGLTTIIEKNEIDYNAYLEYAINDKCIYLTLKDIKPDPKCINILKDNINTLNLLPYSEHQYWHVKKYDLDTSKLDNKDFIDSFKKAIEDLLPTINSDIKTICNVVNNFLNIN